MSQPGSGQTLKTANLPAGKASADAGAPADLPAVAGEEDYLDLRENLQHRGSQAWRLNFLLTGGYLLAGLLIAGGLLAWHHWARH